VKSLDDNYDAIPDDFQKVFSEFEAHRKQVIDRIMDSGFMLRGLSTPEEYEKLTNIGKRKGLYKQSIRPPG
jgi:hypothetical protein